MVDHTQVGAKFMSETKLGFSQLNGSVVKESCDRPIDIDDTKWHIIDYDPNRSISSISSDSDQDLFHQKNNFINIPHTDGTIITTNNNDNKDKIVANTTNKQVNFCPKCQL